MANLNEEIKQAISIVDVISEYIPLTKKGQNYWAICPFHNDTSPSLSVSETKQLFKCFVCGVGGDAFQFLVKFLGISYVDALKKLAIKVGLESKIITRTIYSKKQAELVKLLADATAFFQNNLYTQNAKGALAYISKRIVDKQLIEKFEIGYCHGSELKKHLLAKGYPVSDIINAGLLTIDEMPFFYKRLIFPIRNIHGDVVGFSGRTLQDHTSKYINSPEGLLFKKNELIYNFFKAKNSTNDKNVFLCEGFMDVIALSKVGVNNAASLMGTALTKNHVNMLKNFKISLFLDNDKAGIIAAKKSILDLLNANIETKVVVNDIAKDPDEVLSKFGDQKLITMLDNRVDALSYIYDLLKPAKLDDFKLLNDFLENIRIYLRAVSALEQDFYINKIASEYKIDIQKIKNFIGIATKSVTQEIKPTSIEPKTIKQLDYPYYLIYALSINESLYVNIFKEWKREHKIVFDDGILEELALYLIKELKLESLSKSRIEDIINMWNEIKLFGKNINSIFGYDVAPKDRNDFKTLLNRYKKNIHNKENQSYNLEIKSFSSNLDKISKLKEQINFKKTDLKNGN